ncbi:hypothetical protein PFISCL1PPCAC_11048, partial [Pristionchus fissidentatus]
KATEIDLMEVINLATHTTKAKDELAAELRLAYFGNELPTDKSEFLRKMTNVSSDYWFFAATLEMCRKSVAIQ